MSPRFLHDFTRPNKLLLGMALGLMALMATSVLRYQRWARQYWSTDVAGASSEVFDLREGCFRSSGGECTPLAEGLVRAETDSISTMAPTVPYELTEHEDALRFVPHRLDLTWFSARERRFYRGSFILPQARIDSLFAAIKNGTDTTGWCFYRQPRDYDALPAQTEPGLVLSVRLGRGGQVRLDVLNGRYGQYARPVALASFQATPYLPTWPTPDRAPYQAASPAAYRDSLVAHLDSTQQALIRQPVP